MGINPTVIEQRMQELQEQLTQTENVVRQMTVNAAAIRGALQFAQDLLDADVKSESAPLAPSLPVQE